MPDVVEPLSNALKKTIVVVGYNPSYNDSIISSILKQNKFIADFLSLKSNNNIENHMKLIKFVPLKTNGHLSQAILRVSSAMKSLLRQRNDKLLVGMLSVKIYDRINVIRCYGCQKFGHIQSICPTPSVTNCSKCGKNHDTQLCSAVPENFSCVNCQVNGEDDHQSCCISH